MAKGEKDFTHNAFDDENMKVLVDSAFSALYLDSETKNQPGKLGFDELDQNRRKILTVIYKTAIPEKIKESLTEHTTFRTGGSETTKVYAMQRRILFGAKRTKSSTTAILEEL